MDTISISPLVRKENYLQLQIPFSYSLTDRKNTFLNSIKSPSKKIKYKRYLGSPLRYGGGKSLAVGFVMEFIPVNIKRIISPFFGGGSVEIALARELGIKVLGFDIFDILVNYWNVQLKRPHELYQKLLSLNPTKKQYEIVKFKLKSHWKKEKKLSSIDLATYYYFNHNLSYGPGFLGWMSKIYEDKKRYHLMIEKVKNFSAEKMQVKCDVFENVIPKFKKDFLYCDPPYYLKDDSKMFRGIYPQRNFPVHHNNFNHEKLRDLLLKHKGGFILSYNDCSTVRKWYSDCKIIDVSWQYTMGQGETRIGLNRKNENRNHVKNSHEILIVKYEYKKSDVFGASKSCQNTGAFGWQRIC
ncbi:MAG: DNA adenine methylase [Armatimonadetes bacterium]|nr:DNA adenine methylase [Armatimonadota bacterium]